MQGVRGLFGGVKRRIFALKTRSVDFLTISPIFQNRGETAAWRFCYCRKIHETCLLLQKYARYLILRGQKPHLITRIV